jgi:hypothetical protein
MSKTPLTPQETAVLILGSCGAGPRKNFVSNYPLKTTVKRIKFWLGGGILLCLWGLSNEIC